MSSIVQQCFDSELCLPECFFFFLGGVITRPLFGYSRAMCVVIDEVQSCKHFKYTKYMHATPVASTQYELCRSYLQHMR